MPDAPPLHMFRWRRVLGGECRHGQPCRVVARGRLNSVLVEFRDGWRVITSRYAVRKA
jgi:hypothetical protein